jgi:hypothetical protein
MSVVDDPAIALHEAGHAVVARLLDLEVTKVAAGMDAGVRTRYQLTEGNLEKAIIVDLAGQLAELHGLQERWQTDERNALSRALRIVLLRRGLRDDQLTDELRADAETLVAQLRAEAETLVGDNWAAIGRVAFALADHPLTQREVDALLAS